MGKIIVLDPGHGLKKNGQYSRPLMNCTGKEVLIVNNSIGPHPYDEAPMYYREDFGTLEIAKHIKKHLTNQGHCVFLTRENNENAELFLSKLPNAPKKDWESWQWIKYLTKSVKADIFISIHTNAGQGTGTSCFWAQQPNGVTLSAFLTKEINNEFRLKVRKIEKHRYLILRDTCNGRAVLLECLFHDNMNDIKLLLEPNGMERMGKAISIGINNFSLTF
jgi:N-acetylmuramoyl-L-alanine amidase